MAGWQQCNICGEYDYVDWPNGVCGKCKRISQTNSDQIHLEHNQKNTMLIDFEAEYAEFARNFSANYSLESILSAGELFNHSKEISKYASDALKIIYHSQIVIYEILNVFINEKENNFRHLSNENIENVNQFFMIAASIIMGYASRIALMEEELLRKQPLRKNINVYGLILSAIDLLPKGYKDDVISVYLKHLYSIREKTLVQTYDSGVYKFIPVRIDDTPLKNISPQERIQNFLNTFYAENLKLNCYQNNSFNNLLRD